MATDFADPKKPYLPMWEAPFSHAGFPHAQWVRNPPATQETQDKWVQSPREGDGYPLQCFCPGNLMNREAWRATVHGVAKSQTRLS